MSKADDGKPVWAPRKRFTAEEAAQTRFARDGASFDAKSVDQDVKKAHALVGHPPKGTLTLTGKNGDILSDAPKSDVIAVASKDGAPRTMFKPHDGMARWKSRRTAKSTRAWCGGRNTRTTARNRRDEVVMADPKHIQRTGQIAWPRVRPRRHPFNPASEMRMVALGDPAGMTQLGVHMIRIPPGKESFIPHAHSVSEEFVYVVEGAGEMVLDGVGHPVGPGDFVGFPIDGVVHSLKSKGPGDLVYLTAGRRDPIEVADMPSIGKTTVFRNGKMELFDVETAERLTGEEWMARTTFEA